MPKNEMYVEIPVRPHVKLFLEKNVLFKQCDKKMNVITTSTPVGSYLLKLLRPKSKPNFPLRYNPDNIITVYLNDNYNIVVRPYLSPEAALKFNLFVERLIKEYSYIWIEAYISLGKDIKVAIPLYQEKYQIRDEDMSFDKFSKAFYRHRKRLESRKNRAA